jgi:tRNA threonylcarbamoyladenosine biosynthesis protein TsaE
MEITTNSADATKKAGEEFSAQLKPGDVVGFVGGLGAGKTTFIQGMAKGLGIKERIISPTFILMRNYKPNFFHVDLYRLEGALQEEFENLGLAHLIAEGRSIIAIEWAEKAKNLLPKKTIWVNISEMGENNRVIKI